MKQQVIDLFKDLFNKIKTKAYEYTPSVFAEKNRTLSSDVSSIQGKFKYDFTPYLREIIDTLSPYHPAKIISVIKGAQIGFTEGVIVNGILWIIANNPGNILALSANDTLSKEMVESRLDQGIQSCKLSHLIRPNTIRKRNQRTGDTSNYKEFAGGRLFAGGLKSIDKLGKQRSIKYGFFDDWDAADISDKKQGNLFELIQQRFSTNYNTMKQYYISTPETKPSNIESVYLKGDQRKWHIPCPLCQQYIELIWNDKNKKGENIGIIYKTDEKGELLPETVKYKCQECGGEWDEKHKYKANLKGKWIPTAKPERPYMYSYHISCLVAAPNMYDWTYYAYKYVDIFKDGRVNQSKYKVFKNVVLGEAWEEKKSQIPKGKLISNTRQYDIGIVPTHLSEIDGNGKIVLLTCSCDLNGTLDDARLDWEVVGHSESGSMYSINHGSIGTYQSGRKKNENREYWTYRNNEKNNVWDYFFNEIVNVVYHTDDGYEMRILMTGVDTGYYTHYAYGFIDSYLEIVVGIKGDVAKKMQKAGVDNQKFKPARERPNLYILQVDLLKDELADMIMLKWSNNDMPQPAGFINFPIPDHKQKKYDNYYFRQYEAEEKKIETDDDGNPTGWKWVRKHSSTPNHFFDCAIYNLALRKIICKNLMMEWGKKYGTWAEFVEIIKKIS